MKTIKAILILAVATFTLAFTTTLEKVMVKDSSIHWVGKKVTGQHEGDINLKSGYFEMEGENITGGTFIIDMSSLSCTDLEGESKGQLEGHLKSDDFFGVNNHPEATLIIKKAVKKGSTYSVTGDLTIKEITKPISFDIVKSGNTMTTLLTIDRSEYDIKYNSGSFFDGLGDKMIYDDFTLDVTMTL